MRDTVARVDAAPMSDEAGDVDLSDGAEKVEQV